MDPEKVSPSPNGKLELFIATGTVRGAEQGSYPHPSSAWRAPVASPAQVQSRDECIPVGCTILGALNLSTLESDTVDPIYWTSFLAVAAPLITLALTQRHSRKMAKEAREGRREELAFEARKSLSTERLEAATALLAVVEKFVEYSDFNDEQVGEEYIPDSLRSEGEMARARARLLADPRRVVVVDQLYEVAEKHARLRASREAVTEARMKFMWEWADLLVADSDMGTSSGTAT